jgi:hypothetical protein
VEYYTWVNIVKYVSEKSQPSLTAERQEDRILSYQKPNKLRPERIAFLNTHVSCI